MTLRVLQWGLHLIMRAPLFVFGRHVDLSNRHLSVLYNIAAHLVTAG